MAGPAIRYWEMAHALSSQGLDVTLAVPNRTSLTSPDLQVRSHRQDERTVRGLVSDCDVFVIQGLILYLMPFLKEAAKPIVVDIYTPFVFENLENHAYRPLVERHRIHRRDLAALCDQLSTGDFFICASQRQRDFWLGMMSALGRVNPLNYTNDKSLEGLIAVVPFGLPSEPPQHRRPVLKGVWPGINSNDRVLLWGGSILEWFDPLSLVQAMKQVAKVRNDVKLFFMGRGHPNPGLNAVLPMEVYDRAVQLSRDLDLINKCVFFNQEWVPYEERAEYLLEADIGVSTHFDYVEVLFSFRTRLLDYLWADLPMLVSGGDSMSEEVVHGYSLGEVIPPGDVEGLAQAILRMTDVPNLRELYRPRFAAVKEQFRWDRVVEPLARFCRSPRLAPDRRRD